MALLFGLATNADAQWFEVRNSGGGAPNAPATIYLGDTGLTFGCDAWGTLGGQWGGATVYIHTGTDIHNGTAGAAINYTSTDAKSNTSGKFTSTGTWYWGIRMQYNTSGTIVGWYCRNNGTWAAAWGTPVSDLTLTVNALGDPTGQTATKDGTNPSTQINLAWTKWNSKNVMAVRSTSSNFTAPTQGSAYSTGATLGSGTVVYNGSDTTYNDTGRNPNTTYYYKFYSENYSYYSAGSSANATTDPPANPTPGAVSVDGQQAADLSWTKSGSLSVMVVKSTSATATRPTDTVAYNVGDSIGSGKVIYKGAATSYKGIELTANTTWNFFYYSYSGNYYSNGQTNNTTTTSFGADEIYDSLSYTNGNNLNTKNLGNGFSGAWSDANPGAYVIVSTNFSAYSGYPAEKGHAVSVTPPAAAARTADRSFSSISAGEVFIGYVVKYRYDENNAGTDGKYVGVSMIDGSTEEIFFGEVDSAAQAIGVDPQGDGSADDAGLDSMGNATNYIVIGKYNFATKEAKVAIYTNAAAVPTSEPTTWAGETTMTTGPAEIDGIRLEAGASSGTPGECIFDEIRVGRSWGDVVRTASYIFDDGGSGHDWSTAGNWSSATEPTSANNAYVGNSLTAVVSQASEAANNLDIADGTAQTGTVQQTAGSLTVSGDFTLGDDFGNKGVYQMSGGTLTVAGTAHIGDAGLGQMTVYGASSDLNFQGVLAIGDGSTDENYGSYLHLDGGTVTVDGQFYLGASAQGADGTLIMSGGVFEANSVFNIGEVNSSTGRVYVKDGSIVGGSSDDIYIGDAGYGFMQVSGGTVDVNGTGGDIFIGDDANGGRVNELEVIGGLVDVENNIEMGDSSGASGLLDIHGGRLEIGDDLYVGDEANGTGTVTMVGGTMKVDNLYVGNAGIGAMTLGGGAVTASVFSVGQASGGSGTATVTNGRLYVIANGDLIVGNAGAGVLNIGGGAVLESIGGSTHPMIVGGAATGNGTVNQTGGRVEALDNTDLIIGNVSGASGVYKLSGGTMDLDSSGTSNGDDLTVSNGTMHLVGVNWTNTIDDDMFIGPDGEMTFEFIAGAIRAFSVDDDLFINSGATLNITQATDIVGGTYVVITSENSSAVSGTFNTTNWQGSATGTVSYTAGRVALVFNPDMDILGTNLSIIADGDSTPDQSNGANFGDVATAGGTKDHIFTITNNTPGIILQLTGNPLVSTSGTHAADFKIISVPGDTNLTYGESTSFTVRFDPGADGARTAVITVSNNTADVNPYNFTILGTGITAAVSEMAVLGTNVNQEIVDGDASPTVVDGTDFGSVDINGFTQIHTFTITNSGSATLHLTDASPDFVSIGGTHAADFTVTTQPTSTNIAANATNLFVITFDPSATGLRSATVSIGNDDSNENPYNFSIQGTGYDVDIDVLGTNMTELTNGDDSPSAVDGTSFGSVDVDASKDHVFTITNSGNVIVYLTNASPDFVEIYGHTGDFTVQTQPTSTNLAVSGTNAFVIRFDPTTTGSRTGLVLIGHSDPGKDPFTFAINGTGIDEEISIRGTNHNEITDGSTSPTAALGTDFGSILDTATKDHVFSITNVGTGPLYLTDSSPIVSIGGAHSADFTVTSDAGSTTILAGARTQFTVRFDPTAAGVRTAEVSVANSDSDENPYNFRIIGTATGPDDPTVDSVTPDGGEAMDLVWTENANSDNVLILRGTGAATHSPTNGDTYAVGSHIGNGRVIFNGAASGYKDVGLADGTTYYYTFYSVSAMTNYSSGASDSDATVGYGSEIVEPVSYTNGVSLNSMNGGSGFSGAWSVGSGTFAVQTNYGAGSGTLVPIFQDIDGYPDNHGHRIKMSAAGAGGQSYATRSISAVSGGKIYAACIISYQWDEDYKFAGMTFMSNTVAKGFFGKVPSASWRNLGVSQGGGNSATLTESSPEYEFNSYDNPGHDAGNNTGAVFLIIGRYDFSTRELATKGYYRTETVPTAEPSTWDASRTLDANHANAINAVRIEAGALGAGDGDIGTVYFDEVRVANSWDELIGLFTYEFTDNGSGHDWSTAGNWTGAQEPIAASNAWINGSYTAVVSSAGSPVASNLYVGSDNAPSTGANPTGMVFQTGGTLTLSGDLILGDDTTDVGYYLITNGTLNVLNEDIFIGDQGVGIMTVTGTATVAMTDDSQDNVLIGFGSLSGAEDAGSTLYMGGDAVFSVGNDLRVGFYGGAEGSVVMAGGSLYVTNEVYLGGWGGGGGTNRGDITMSGGMLLAGTHIKLGEKVGSTGVVTMTGGELSTADGNILIGNDGFGYMSVAGTATVDVNGTTWGDLIVGDNSPVTNTLAVSGNGLVDIADNLFIGDDVAGANGIITIEDSGWILVGNAALIGDNANSTGKITVSSGVLAIQGTTYIGNNGTATLNINGGSVTGNYLLV
ncbi:MAG: choice-of-anchor D domain-containing protein, partial [Verrucomicrobia bacterium]|nr:choice-of-anchor D domain-containing protein [Verrucomicrobiota bacterium]